MRSNRPWRRARRLGELRRVVSERALTLWDRNPICERRMAMKSRYLRESLVIAVIAKITNHLEVCVRNRSIGTRLLRPVGSPSLQGVQEVGLFRNSNMIVELTFDQMRFTNGPPLSMGGQLRWPLQLRPLHKISLARRYCLFLSPHYGLPPLMGCRQLTILGQWFTVLARIDSNVYFVGSCADGTCLHLLELCRLCSCPRSCWYL